MSAAIAMAPSPAPHDRPGYAELAPAPTTSATSSSTAATATSSPAAMRTTSTAPSGASNANAAPQRSNSGSPAGKTAQPARTSPPSVTRVVSGSGPKIVVKKEPGSPDSSAGRHRPRKLDLSKNTFINSGAATARPPSTRDGLGIQEVGLACLSPGFVTQDPAMKEQLQRSISVREQQRHIIESRLQQQSAKGDGPNAGKDKDSSHQFSAKTPGLSGRKKAPPGLSIVAPSASQFATERVIQSAPLGQTFTGINKPQPLARQLGTQPSNLSSTSHVHHVPATQTANRLPPIAEVFAQNVSGPQEATPRPLYPPGSSQGPLASPGRHPPSTSQPPMSDRSREFKSAEEAQQELSGGRPELLPKIVHYNGHQPPTSPSPRVGAPLDTNRSASRRRTRAEYEEGGSPPLGNGPTATRRGAFGAGRDSPATQDAKREEFLRLCERAWDLFHS